ncbi:MAG: hypothetical protein ABSH51_27210 [Solirubrobacteraceae bacterium]|jgi:hypothetical protein
MDDDQDIHEPLVTELRALFASADPVPLVVTQAAKAALGWRRLDADLAELLSDSTLQDDALALARGAGAPVRSVSFSAGVLTIEIEIHADGDRRLLLGQLMPPAAARIEVQHAGAAGGAADDDGDGASPAAERAESDRLGRFRIRLAAGGSIRLVVSGDEPGATSAVETSWIAI